MTSSARSLQTNSRHLRRTTLKGKTMTLSEVEAALDSGKLFARMANGSHWQCRRNGATKTWKTRPGEFRIPVKAGLRICGYVQHDNQDDFEVR